MIRPALLLALLLQNILPVAEAAERFPGARLDYYFDRPGEDAGYSIRQTLDGGYLVAGTSAGANGDKDLALWKFDNALQPDPDFAEQGLLRLGSSADDVAVDAIQVLDASGMANGYLVLGYAAAADRDFSGENHRGGIDTVILRLDNHGRPVPDWHNNGVLFWGGEADDSPLTDYVQPGKPGEPGEPGKPGEFRESGHRILQLGESFIILSHTRSRGGDLAGSVTADPAGGQDAVLLKLKANAEMDSEFAQQGLLRLGNLSGRQPGDEFLFSLTELYSGHLAVVGYTTGQAVSRETADTLNRDQAASVDTDVVVVQLSAAGRLQEDWGEGGVVVIGGSGQDRAFFLSEDNDRRLLISGRSDSNDGHFSGRSGSGDGMMLFRLLQDGSVDRRFAQIGALLLSGGGGQFQQALTLRDYSIAALGFSRSNEGTFSLTDGADLQGQVILALYGETGERQFLFSIGAAGEDRANALLLDREGNLLLSGFRSPPPTEPGDQETASNRRQLWLSRYELGF
jgi:hypothetical protein